MGFPQPKPLGNKETGSRAALPIWIDYMEPILEDYPVKMLVEPEGILPLKVKESDGTLAGVNEPGIYEYFYDEFLPQNNAYFMIN
jgi:penicillin-binding protein 1A